MGGWVGGGGGHTVAALQLVEEPGVRGNLAWSPHSGASTRTHFVTGVRGGCTGGTVFVSTGTFEWDSAIDQRPSSRSRTNPPGYPFDNPFIELGTSHSSRLVCEALPNVENVPIIS